MTRLYVIWVNRIRKTLLFLGLLLLELLGSFLYHSSLLILKIFFYTLAYRVISCLNLGNQLVVRNKRNSELLCYS